MTYSRITPPFWGVVWIIAGGPSALRFDISRMQTSDVVLVINDAMFLIAAWALQSRNAFFTADHNWVSRHRKFLSTFPGERFVAVPLETWPECGGIDGVTYLQRGYNLGLSADPGVLETGGNSGYAAINLAFLKKATLIHLVGYDMCGEKYRQWIPRFRTMLSALTENGVKVLNHSPNSWIDAFPRVN